MKVSELWLREWVNPAVSVQTLASQLTMAGLEIDALNPVAGLFDKVIVAEVIQTRVHPQADRLTLCEVNIGKDTSLQIVCGAANVRPGLKTALAMTGASLPGGMCIKETRLRGELSQGMLCSLTELGMADESDGIIELDKAAPVGQSLREYLKLDDHLLDINLTPNRADCFSVSGIAREIAAINAMPISPVNQEKIIPEIDDRLSIDIGNPQACPRYCGRIIRGINPQAVTPMWMAERLRRSGLRLIHPVVDVCNYVMLELGQPMHAFDLQKIESGISVRMAEDKEPLILLDGQEISLNSQSLIIADKHKVLALAGVMGGAGSAVQAETVDIFLESAFFHPLALAGTARTYGLCTDASQRFERGVDPFLPLVALERASRLLMDITGGKAAPVLQMDADSFLPQARTLLLDTEKVKKLTGVSISLADMQSILERLEMRVSMTAQKTVFSVNIPSHRFDIHADVDLVEEIIRIYGYDNIQPEPMHGLIKNSQSNAAENLVARFSQALSNRGYHETISYSFVDPELQTALFPDVQAMQLLNPISSELAEMRLSLWPGLIASLIYNLHRQQNTLQLFETGVIFDMNNSCLNEKNCMAGIVTGERGALNWSEKAAFFDFFDVKGDLEAILKNLHCGEVSFMAAQHSALHPGQAAKVLVAGKEAGWIGVLHPRLAEALDINNEVILFELCLDSLTSEKTLRYQPLSKYPQIRRDLSFLVDEKVSAASIEACVRKTLSQGWLKSYAIFDVYTGKGVPEGQKSLAIALTLQNPDKTLTDAEINAEIGAIIKVLIDEFSITLRD